MPEKRMNVQQYWGNMARVRIAHMDEFTRIFTVGMKPYWDNRTGFDIVKFDKDVLGESDEPMYGRLLEKYGQEACDFIERLQSAERTAFEDGTVEVPDAAD